MFYFQIFYIPLDTYHNKISVSNETAYKMRRDLFVLPCNISISHSPSTRYVDGIIQREMRIYEVYIDGK